MAYSGRPAHPYDEIVLPEAGSKMVLDLSGSHRLGYPDLWIVGQRKPLTAEAQRELLAILHRVREVRPREFWFIYADSYGFHKENPFYLMRSKDGLRFTAVTHAEGWEDFVSEVEMLIEHHDEGPADDPHIKARAAFMGYTPLDGD